MPRTPIVKAYLCAENLGGATKKKGKGEFPARETRMGMQR